MFVHNAKPHNFRGEVFWDRCSKLTQQVDVFLHFSVASVKLLRDELGAQASHEIVNFPIAPSARPASVKKHADPHLVLVGVRDRRKCLDQFLAGDANTGGIPIVASGFDSSQDFLEYFGLHQSAREKIKDIRWIGVRASAEDLSDLLRPPNKLFLNQANQLNSGLMWLALSQGAGVIAPRTETFEEIAESFDNNSVQLFEPDLVLNPGLLKKMLAIQPEPAAKELWALHSYDVLAERLVELVYHQR